MLDFMHSSFFEHLSLQREQNQGEEIIISALIEKEHLADPQTIGSGIYYTMLDIAMGTAASNAGGAPSATIVLNTTIFDAAVKSSLICRAKVTNCFEGMASAEGWVYDENQTLIAKSQADFKLLKRS
ncbi:PaaI family thioesterase [Metabacillus idriensis]|uniref:PaaI family thioesterase n=1 Tax=Metabacillus idriensis TaxID=324768 RepID=UPI0017493DAB|nr:PaaI family thioesterase [Metabacillus idriensis]